MIIPIHYNVLFIPDFQTFITDGFVKIHCMVSVLMHKIKLNAKELEIKSAAVICDGKKQSALIEYNYEDEYIELNYKSAVIGDVILNLEFSCVNNEKMYGFYRSKYIQDKKEKFILTTQFEPTNARAAFPCFDDPVLKARFNISMVIDEQLQAISNTEEACVEKLSQGKKLVRFRQTPLMSPYLLYLGVGDFKCIKTCFSNIKISVIFTPDHEVSSITSLDYAKKSIAWLEEYFRIKYPLSKLDHIAVPDFAMGAMENWGAITFKETALLVNEKTSFFRRKQSVITISHEHTHQWLGNLITMKWWNDLWLNESFAAFISYKVVGSLFPKWHMSIQFTLNTIGTALEIDGYYNTHIISVNVQSPPEIEAIFDEITYEKGSSVLCMLEDCIGEEIFRNGLHRHITKHRYSNVDRTDLWNVMQEVANESHKNFKVVEFMEDWITKPGYPIIYVESQNNGFFLSQERYTVSGNLKGAWILPIRFITSSGADLAIMQDEVHFIPHQSEWIKLNHGQKGLYRVMYERRLLQRIGEMIKDEKLSSIDSWGVENDLFSFMVSGIITPCEYLEFITNYCMKIRYPTSVSISEHLVWLNRMCKDSKFITLIKSITSSFHSNILHEFGWKGALSYCTVAGLKSVKCFSLANKARELFERFIEGKEDIDVEIRDDIYKIVARNGDVELFNTFMKKYMNEKMPDEKQKLLRTLGHFKDLNLIQRALKFTISSNVRLQDSHIIPAALSRTPEGIKILWLWMKDKWLDLKFWYDPSTGMLSFFIDFLFNVSDHELKEEIIQFFSDKKNMRSDIRRKLLIALENIDVNIKFKEKINHSSISEMLFN